MLCAIHSPGGLSGGGSWGLGLVGWQMQEGSRGCCRALGEGRETEGKSRWCASHGGMGLNPVQ